MISQGTVTSLVVSREVRLSLRLGRLGDTNFLSIFFRFFNARALGSDRDVIQDSQGALVLLDRASRSNSVSARAASSRARPPSTASSVSAASKRDQASSHTAPSCRNPSADCRSNAAPASGRQALPVAVPRAGRRKRKREQTALGRLGSRSHEQSLGSVPVLAIRRDLTLGFEPAAARYGALGRRDERRASSSDPRCASARASRRVQAPGRPLHRPARRTAGDLEVAVRSARFRGARTEGGGGVRAQGEPRGRSRASSSCSCSSSCWSVRRRPSRRARISPARATSGREHVFRRRCHAHARCIRSRSVRRPRRDRDELHSMRPSRTCRQSPSDRAAAG